MKSTAHIFDKRYEIYRNLEGNPAVPLLAKQMIHAAMEEYAFQFQTQDKQRELIESFGRFQLLNDTRYETGRNAEWGSLDFNKKVDKFFNELSDYIPNALIERTPSLP